MAIHEQIIYKVIWLTISYEAVLLLAVKFTLLYTILRPISQWSKAYAYPVNQYFFSCIPPKKCMTFLTNSN